MSDTFKHNAFTEFFSDTRSDKTALEDSPTSPASSNPSVSLVVDNAKPVAFVQKTLDVINDRISKRPASLVQYNSTKQKFSKRINLANSNAHVAAVCDYTGAVVAITFPAIPGKVFSYCSPLADLRNCRGLAQEGKDYLRKLDTQTLAAILITLADDYSLFRYQPSDSGAQKNAILRTVSKDILIDGILFIEEFINSNNCLWIPKLSLILTAEVQQGGIQIRMSEWLKVSIEAVYKPDEETYEEAVSKGSKESKQYAYKPVTNAATKRAAIALQKDFRQWKRESKDIIISLAASSTITAKIKGFLLTLVADQNLLLADVNMISLICERLNQIDDTRTRLLAKNISFYRTKLLDSEESEFNKPAEETFASQPVGSAIQPVQQAEDNEFATPSAPATVPSETAKMSFKERIAYLRSQKVSASVVTIKSSKENEDAPL